MRKTAGLVAAAARRATGAASTQVIDKGDLKPGDLVFFNTMATPSAIGVYLGDGQSIHSPRTGQQVRVEDLCQASYWQRRFNGRRVALDGDAVARLSLTHLESLTNSLFQGPGGRLRFISAGITRMVVTSVPFRLRMLVGRASGLRRNSGQRPYRPGRWHAPHVRNSLSLCGLLTARRQIQF
ncbi:MAG: C40 family peptidase [Simplicispira sp.]|nr:C40 family peptidase [Simplicispira sp.]